MKNNIRKIICVFLAVVLFACVILPLSSGARIYDLNPLYTNSRFNSPINIVKGTPVLDGEISENEGWSMPVALNASNMCVNTARSAASFPTDVTIDVCFAYDARGLYIAADIHDGHVVATEGPNGEIWNMKTGTNPEAQSTDAYGIDGDDFIFTIDPNFDMMYGGEDNSDFAAWYNISFTMNGDDPEITVFRTFVNYGDITGLVDGKAAITEKGWKFEICLPWETVVLPDAYDGSLNQFSGTVADVTADGFKSGANIQYVDRFELDETYGKYRTVKDFFYDSVYGPASTTEYIETNALTLVNVESGWVNVFKDVKPGLWYEPAVKYVYSNGLMYGTSASAFGGSGNVTKGMFVTVLGRIAGIDKNYYKPVSISDVNDGDYYAAYMEWALRNGIIEYDKDSAGNSLTTVSPNKVITRAEIAQILYGYTNWFSNDTQRRLGRLRISYTVNLVGEFDRAALNGFSDNGSVPEQYKTAMAFAVTSGLFKGSNGKLNPNSNITRFETAVVFHNISTEFLRSRYDMLSEQMNSQSGVFV